MNSRVIAIAIAREPGVPMTSISTAHLVPGKGIEGDRFYTLRAQGKSNDDTACDITFVEREAIEVIHHTRGGDLWESFARRNIVTYDCALEQLIGRIFRVGDVQLQGLMPHKQCLSEDTRQSTNCLLLIHATLRARILTEGTISVGDYIQRF